MKKSRVGRRGAGWGLAAVVPGGVGVGELAAGLGVAAEANTGFIPGLKKSNGGRAGSTLAVAEGAAGVVERAAGSGFAAEASAGFFPGLKKSNGGRAGLALAVAGDAAGLAADLPLDAFRSGWGRRSLPRKKR